MTDLRTVAYKKTDLLLSGQWAVETDPRGLFRAADDEFEYKIIPQISPTILEVWLYRRRLCSQIGKWYRMLDPVPVLNSSPTELQRKIKDVEAKICGRTGINGVRWVRETLLSERKFGVKQTDPFAPEVRP